MTLTVTHVCDLCDLPLGPKKNKKGVGRDPEMDDWLSAPESAQDKSMSRCPGVLSALGAQMLRALLRNLRFQGQIPATPTGPTRPSRASSCLAGALAAARFHEHGRRGDVG